MSKTQDERRKQAMERGRERKQRTPKEQLALLDVRLGKGVGAERERARLINLITNAAN